MSVTTFVFCVCVCVCVCVFVTRPFTNTGCGAVRGRAEGPGYLPTRDGDSRAGERGPEAPAARRDDARGHGAQRDVLRAQDRRHEVRLGAFDLCNKRLPGLTGHEARC